MKRCTKCKRLRPASRYYKHNNGRVGRVARCDECIRNESRARYRRNRSSRLAQKAQARAERRKLVHDLKQRACMDCGEKYPPHVMDFDHLPGTEKIGDVASLMNSGPVAKLVAEIAKCDLVCANCHRMRTHDRRQHRDDVDP